MSVELRVLAVMLFITLDAHLSHAVMKLAAPQHVKITSINMGAVVEWKYPHNPSDNVTYTTRYILRNNVTDLCIDSKELKCDAGKLPYIFASYVFQVRAEDQGGSLSGLTHPNSNLIGTVIEKKINKGQGDEDVKLTIKALNLWSRYCVQAQVIPKGFSKETPFSDTVCVTNIPVLNSCMIAAAVLLLLVILASWMIYKVKVFLYPKTELPDRFSKFEVTQHTTSQKEQLDKISAISEDQAYERLSENAFNPEDTCCLAPIQEVEDEYKHLFQLKPAPTFYPNHLYPLCLKNKVLTHLNPPVFASPSVGQSHYYNITDISFNPQCTDGVY